MNKFFKKVLHKCDTILYLVVDSENDNLLYTVTPTKKSADEYIRKAILMKNYEHFNSWCKFHSKDSKSIDAVNEYLVTVALDDFNKFEIREVGYRTDVIAMMFRLANKCVPLGCSFEFKDEHSIYADFDKQNNSDKY